MLEHDRQNFIKLLREFPNQLTEARKFSKKFKPDVHREDITNIVFAGMGGSAISGDLLIDYMKDNLDIPAVVNREYGVPNYVNEQTLFIAMSYSGNTEETLSATREALARKAKVMAITTGGEIESLCEAHKRPMIKVPAGLPPRQALGYLFTSALTIIEKMRFIPSQTKFIKETTEVLNTIEERFDPKKSFGNNLANHIAQSIYHAVPVCYTGTSYLGGVVVRWRNQLSENSKVLAFSNVFPELNHNEIMGMEGLEDVNKHFRIVFLRSSDEHPRVQDRIRITKEVLRKNKVLFGEVFPEGESKLAQMFSLIYIGDWASFYLAMLNGKDPMTIDSINYLKDKLSQTPA